MKSFGEYIRHLRETLDVPQRKVAETLDMDVSVLSRIESNNRLPKKGIDLIIARLAQLFGKDEQELWDCYLSDQVAKQLMECTNVDAVMDQAKSKIHYLKNKSMVQSTIKFD